MPPGGGAAAKQTIKVLRPALKRLFKAGHKNLVDDAGKQAARNLEKAGAKGADKAIAKSIQRNAAKNAQRIAHDTKLAKRIAQAAKRGEDPLKHIPAGAKKRVLKPQPGKVRDGVEYSWRGASGKKYTVRVHGRDASRSAAENAGRGPVYRVAEGRNVYYDDAGKAWPGNQLKDKFKDGSINPDYNPKAANDTHIPWPKIGKKYPTE